MTDEEKIRRANRWKAFFEEPEGLRDMLGALRLSRYKLMDEAQPWELPKLANLALGAQVARELEVMIQEIITSGKVAENAKAAAERMAALPDYKRRWVQGVAA